MRIGLMISMPGDRTGTVGLMERWKAAEAAVGVTDYVAVVPMDAGAAIDATPEALARLVGTFR